MFKGLGNIGNLASAFGAMQQLPEKMKELTERMKSETLSVSSSCDRITMVVNGIGEVQQVNVAEGLTGQELEQTFLETSNRAGAAAKEMYGQAISDMMAEMNIEIPGMDGMLRSLTGN